MRGEVEGRNCLKRSFSGGEVGTGPVEVEVERGSPEE